MFGCAKRRSVAAPGVYTATSTFTATLTDTLTYTKTSTFVITPTFTDTSTFTPTQSTAMTIVPTNTFTHSNTFTSTSTRTATLTFTNTFIPSYTYTPTATSTNISAMPRISGVFSLEGNCSVVSVHKNYEVQLYPLGVTTTTDSVTGEFVFYDVPDGNYDLRLTSPVCWPDLIYGNPILCSGEKNVTITGHDITGLVICPRQPSTITPTYTHTRIPTATATPSSTPSGATITGTIHHAINSGTVCVCNAYSGIGYFECATLQPLGIMSCLGPPTTGPFSYQFDNIPPGTYTVKVSSYYSETVIVTDNGIYNMPMACDDGPSYSP